MRLALLTFCFIFAGIANAQEEIILQGVRIVEVDNGKLSAPSDIIIEGNRISAIHPTGEISLNGKIVIDARGKFVLPGLYDMHVHTFFPGYSDRSMDLMIANGVTGFRDTWGFLPLAVQIQKTMEEGKRPYQRFTVAGNLIDGENPIWPGSSVATSPEEGRELVRKLKEEGAGFIKVYSKLKPEVFFAIADESEKVGLEFMGHVPALVDISEASDAGMRSMEHMYGVIEGCSTMEDSIQSYYLGKADNSNTDLTHSLSHTKNLALNHQSDERKLALIAQLAENESWQVPTLITTRNFSYLRDTAYFNSDPRLKYIDSYTLSQWSPETNRFVKDMSDEQWDVDERYYQRKVELLTELNEGGVPIMAGTDPPNPFCIPGFSLHDELAIFVEDCGFTEAEALKAATLNPAIFLGTEKDAGTISAGKFADILILTANPLENIRHTTRIDGLLINGEYLDRAALDLILSRWESK